MLHNTMHRVWQRIPTGVRLIIMHEILGRPPYVVRSVHYCLSFGCLVGLQKKNSTDPFPVPAAVAITLYSGTLKH